MQIPDHRSLDPNSFLRREPRQARSAERLEQLVASTAEILGDEGYSGVTAAALSARTGMPHSTIYDVVGDPRDLVAVWALRFLDEMHSALVAFARTVTDREGAVAFVRAVVAAFFDAYRGDATLRAALAALDADPAYRWISLADSRRNAEVIAGVIQPYTTDAPQVVAERCLLMTHLAGATGAMAVDVGDEEGSGVIRAYGFVVDAVLDS